MNIAPEYQGLVWGAVAAILTSLGSLIAAFAAYIRTKANSKKLAENTELTRENTQITRQAHADTVVKLDQIMSQTGKHAKYDPRD